MGKTKIKLIDDSKPEMSIKNKKLAKSEPVKASGVVELKNEVNDASEEQGAKQTSSERTEDASGALRPDEPAKKVKASKKVKKGQPRVRSKKYKAAVAGMEKGQKLPALEAVQQAQKGSYSKFEGTIEAHLNTNVKNLRGLINMPFAKGKKLRILAFGDLKETDGIIIGNDNSIAEIEKGKVDFDIVVTTPEWMPKLAKVARILGPRSLMPNPKNGTISENLEKTVAELQGGKTEYKTEANGQVIHLPIGKVSQNPEEIVANLKVIYNTVGRSKIQKISLAPTMGPSVKVDLSSLS